MAQKPHDLAEQPWTEVIREVVDQVRTLFQQETQLLKAELGSKAKQAGLGAGMFGVAGFMGFLAAGTLTATIILALATVLEPWVAALAVTEVYGLIAGVLALAGKGKVQDATPFVPERTIETAKGAPQHMKQAWERGAR
jgi:MFS family permease